jgi:hypothetical protein
VPSLRNISAWWNQPIPRLWSSSRIKKNLKGKICPRDACRFLRSSKCLTNHSPTIHLPFTYHSPFKVWIPPRILLDHAGCVLVAPFPVGIAAGDDANLGKTQTPSHE